jgi:hypothetical protein
MVYEGQMMEKRNPIDLEAIIVVVAVFFFAQTV